MVREVVKICGSTHDEIASKLLAFSNCGVSFEVEENCLDARIVMSTELSPIEFGTQKSKLYNMFEDEVYSSMDISLHELVAKLLKMNKKMLAVAESLTGGEICSRLSSVAGISENFFEGIICYNKASKINRLNILPSVLANFGAISRETAHAMVFGLAQKPVDIALATTGLAGPNADEGKPVGLVYIGVGSGDFITTFERNFCGTRAEIQTKATNVALFYLIRYLKGDILRL